jgi:hypothetical protein
VQRHDPEMDMRFRDKVHVKDGLREELAVTYNKGISDKRRWRPGASLKARYTLTLGKFRS